MLSQASVETLREMLMQEADDAAEALPEQFVRMENGTDWLPAAAVRAGNLGELEGLWQDGDFEVSSWDQVL